MNARCLTLVMLSACRFGFEERAMAPTDAAMDASSDAVLPICESRVALPVPTTGRVSGTLATGTGDTGSCHGGLSTDDLYALDVLVPGSRIQIAADEPGTTAVASIYIRTDCADPGTELECDATDGTGDQPQITRAVEPGRYFVFIDGQDGQPLGDYQARLTVLLPAGASCDPTNARDRCDGSLTCIAGTCQPSSCAGAMVLDGPGPHTMSVSTTNQPNVHAGTCGDANDGGLRASELVFQLVLTAPTTRIRLDTDRNGTDYDSLVYIRDACTGAELACDDDGGQNLRAIADTGALPAGTYFLFVDGFSVNAGTAAIQVTAQ